MLGELEAGWSQQHRPNRLARDLDAGRGPRLVDLRVLRYRSLWAGSILSVVVGMALYAALFAEPIFAQALMDYTSQETGMLLLPSAIASAVTMIGAGLGGSIGVALLTLLLTQRQAFHRAVLVEKMPISDPALLERVHGLTAAFSAKGAVLSDAQNQAFIALNGIVNREALVMSFNDTFFATGILILTFLPLVFLLGKPDQGVTGDAGH